MIVGSACNSTPPASPCGSCPSGLACDEPTRSCTREPVTMVPTRDGLHLSTKVYLPSPIAAGGVPTVLMRTPYRFRDHPEVGEDLYVAFGRFMAGRGYALITQDV